MCPWRKPIQVQLFRYRAFAGFFSLLCVYAYLSLIVVFFFCLLSVWFVSTSGEFYFIFFLIPAAAVCHRRDKNRMKRSRTEEGEKSARCPPCIFTSKIERIKEEGKETLSHSSVVIWDSQAEGRLNTLRNTKRVRRQKHIRILISSATRSACVEDLGGRRCLFCGNLVKRNATQQNISTKRETFVSSVGPLSSVSFPLRNENREWKESSGVATENISRWHEKEKRRCQ